MRSAASASSHREAPLIAADPAVDNTDVPAAPSNTGAASVPDYGVLQQQAVHEFDGGGKSYAGQSDDPFFLDLRVFDLLYGGDLSEVGQDTLAGYNVNTLAIQVPKSDLALNGDPARNPFQSPLQAQGPCASRPRRRRRWYRNFD